MPHINIFWVKDESSTLLREGFVPQDQFNKYYLLLKNIKIEPFLLTLNQVEIFKHNKNSTVYLKPNDESLDKIKEIYKKLPIIFKQTSIDDYHPHLSIDSIKLKENNENNIKDKYKYNISYQVNSLYFCSREHTEHMVVKKILNLEDNTNNHINEILDFFNFFDCTVKICGSRFFINENNCDNDLDLLLIGNIDRNNFFNKIIKPIEQCGLFYKHEIIKNDHIYEMKLKTNYINVDSHYVNENDKLEQYYNTSYNLYAQPFYIHNVIKDNLDLFKECLTWTKSLLKKYKSYGQMYGYISGMSIQVLITFIFKNNNITTLNEFKCELKKVNFDEIISLTHTTYNKKTKSDEFMIIQEPTHPYKNTVRNITKSTKAIIIDILKNEKLTIKLDKTIVLSFNTTEEEDVFYLEEINNMMNTVIIKILIKLEKFSDGIIKLFDKWYYTENKKGIYFKIRYNSDASIIDHELEKLSDYANNLINTKNISFSILKK